MKTWIYIETRNISDDDRDGVMVSFGTVQLQAATQASAEYLGAALMDTLRSTTPDDPLNINWQHFQGRFLNYHTVEVVPA